MALSGIQIFQLLPKTNCKECGVPTCLAFAMNLAAGKIELSRCPHISQEARLKLEAESAPPIRTVEIGEGESAFKIGGETVLFRHEKTFFNPTALILRIRDDEPESQVEAKLARFNDLTWERVGLVLRGNGVAIQAASGEQKKFVSLVKKAADRTKGGLVLMTESPELMAAALPVCAARRPLLCAATENNVDAMGKLAREHKLPLVVRAQGLDKLAALAEKLTAAGVHDLVLDSGARRIGQLLQDQVRIREAAIQKRFRPFGFPILALPCEMTDDFMLETVYAATLLAKYASMIVLSDFQGHNLFHLLLERLNLYTDPQRPMKTEQKIYEINNPGPRSPVLCTCNFSLTYFIVSGEIENSRVPAYLAVLDTEGLSVLTAWAAGKFSGEQLGGFINKSGLRERLTERHLIIPGYVAVIRGDLEEALGDEWQVHVGPREASGIPAYLRERYNR